MKNLKPGGYPFQDIVLLSIVMVLWSFVFSSCEPRGDDEQIKSKACSNCIDKGTGQILSDAWNNADSTLVTKSFYINPDSGKVLSFQLGRGDIDTLLHRGEHIGDSLLLRVFLALDDMIQRPISPEKEPAFRPILDLINDKKDVLESDTLFELEYLDMNIIKYLDSIVGKDIYNRVINAAEALQYIVNWDTLPQSEILSVMYEDSIPKDTGRVKYYTFELEDSDRIIKYLQTHPEDQLYLHLGVYDSLTTIPFRTILHLDNPDNFIPPFKINLKDPPLFEFASPCPRACGDQ